MKKDKQRLAAVLLTAAAAVSAAGAGWTMAKPDTAAAVIVAPAAPVRAGTAFLLDLNTAGADELVCLPGIGPATAEHILERREELGGFRSREDVLSVSGIGEATYEKIEPYITY